VKDQYFGIVQLRTLGMSEYVLVFVECADGIREEYVEAFILWEMVVENGDDIFEFIY
jgi:hypothetical protein